MTTTDGNFTARPGTRENCQRAATAGLLLPAGSALQTSKHDQLSQATIIFQRCNSSARLYQLSSTRISIPKRVDSLTRPHESWPFSSHCIFKSKQMRNFAPTVHTYNPSTRDFQYNCTHQTSGACYHRGKLLFRD